jgi:hypothetical protein
MKAITIWQPWASLLACGAKKYETRSWKTDYRGPIAIHVAKKDARSIVRELPYEILTPIYAALYREMGLHQGSLSGLEAVQGCIIATAELVNCWHIVYHPGTNIDIAKHIPIGAESMTNDKHAQDFGDYFVPTEQEMMFGDWTPGRYAWELANVQMLSKPIPAKGKQRLWEWEKSSII